MRAGALRDRVTLQQKQVTRSATGDEVVTWTTVDTLWAKVNDGATGEGLRGAAERAERVGTIELRYVPGIVPQQRFLFGTRTLDITGVQDVDGRRRELLVSFREEAR